ncbi:helix-turn-helix domain-containing protein [Phytohabitans kaempferiae]|uniref:Helix-turn-helix domain-containing protein n=1 Tax=Phytohabitans kaempferiae TaxID=1620943 RepID=A0ABV6MEE2_9ACTN
MVEVALRYGASRQSVYTWKARYERDGLAGIEDWSRRPHRSPHRLAAEIEALVCELRRTHRRWVPGGWCSGWPAALSSPRLGGVAREQIGGRERLATASGDGQYAFGNVVRDVQRKHLVGHAGSERRAVPIRPQVSLLSDRTTKPPHVGQCHNLLAAFAAYR